MPTKLGARGVAWARKATTKVPAKIATETAKEQLVVVEEEEEEEEEEDEEEEEEVEEM